MKLTITVTDMVTKQSFDIQVDSGQRIGTTLKVLNENIPDFDWNGQERVQSRRTNRRIRLQQTYEEAKIYTGDQLWIMR